MTNSLDQVLVQSDIGYGDVKLPIDGEATTVKVTEVKTEPKIMTLQQIEKAKEHINNTVTMADSLLETKKALLETDEAKNKLNAIQGVGDIIKGVLKFIPGPPNPMIEKLQLLEDKVEKIGEKMSNHFADVKSFITEVKFSVKIMSPTLVMIKCMRDCLKYPGQESVQMFREAYKKHSPLRLAYSLLSYLEQKSTNPLRMAMEAERVKTMARFMKWESIFRCIMENFIFLEAFASGVLGIKSKHNLTVLANRTNEVLDSIEDWRDDYKTDENYWAEVKEWFDKYITSSSKLSNQERAKEIAKKLSTYLTDDAFHVAVFDESEWQRDYSYYCPNEKTQLIEARNKGNCCAFIYRSKQANFMEDDEFQNAKEEVLNCVDNKVVLQISFEGEIKKQLVDTKMVRGDGMISLIDIRRNVSFEVSNCPGYPKGPGYWEQIHMVGRVASDYSHLNEKMMLLSLP